MIRCPRCNADLPKDALYCNRCGFNQTNARMQARAAAQGGQPPQPVNMPQAPSGMQPGMGPGPLLPGWAPQQASPAPQNMQAPQQAGQARPPQPMPPSSPSLIRPMLPSKHTAQDGPPVPPQVSPSMQAPAMPGPPPSTPSSPIGNLPPTPQAAPPQQLSPSGGAPGKGLSLMKRYLAEQQAGYQPGTQAPAQPNAQNQPAPPQPGLRQQSPVQSEDSDEGWIEPEQRYRAQQIIRTSTPRPPMMSPQHPQHPPLGAGMQGPAQQVVRTSTPRPGLSELPTGQFPMSAQQPQGQMPLQAHNMPQNAANMNMVNPALARWQRGWWERQRAEAGPAVGVSRGQAVVPEPLMKMQYSLARMRAIILPKKGEDQNNVSSRFKFLMPLMLGLILILAIYNILAPLPGSTSAAPLALLNGAPMPTLTPKNMKNQEINAGQTLHLTGKDFGANGTITFQLDAKSITGAGGQPLSVQADNRGAFDAQILIPATLQVGNHALEALNSSTGQHAFLTLQVLPATMDTTTTQLLLKNANGQPIKSLALKALKNSTGPAQAITLTNTGDTPLDWTAAPITDNGVNWLQFTNGQTSGHLDAGASERVTINVTTVGLAVNTKPYTGYVVFTASQGQVVVPVSLLVQNGVVEVLISPNPIVTSFTPGGSCQQTSLTIANLSNEFVFWNASIFARDQGSLQLNNQATAQGMLQIAGQPGDTQVIRINCFGVRQGSNLFRILVSYNLNTDGGRQTIPVSIV